MTPNDAEQRALPRVAETKRTLPPRRTPGYYPNFFTLDQGQFWDAKTREVVCGRVERPPEIRFFSADEYAFWQVVFAHLMPQEDRVAERRIPVVAYLDERLHKGATAGYRYANMPRDEDAYRLGRRAIDAESGGAFAKPFIELTYRQREQILQRLHEAKPQFAAEIWRDMAVERFWQLLMSDAAAGYYCHPWAWDEIGFGGPAYPRGYMRLERGDPEPWEVHERRYDWLAPEDAESAS